MPGRFEFAKTELQGLMLIRQKPIDDARGSFSRVYCAEEFRAAGMTRPISQINHSVTYGMGAVRGMHYQLPPHAEAKVVFCLKGEAFDVAVDLREGSPTFLRWQGVKLSAAARNGVYIPEGFAHGFQALTDDCELLYLHAGNYMPEAERALNAADPRLAIAWPLPIAVMSDRDRAHPMLTPEFKGVRP